MKKPRRSLQDPTKNYSKIQPDISDETRAMIYEIMESEQKLLWQVIEKAIHQYSNPAAVAPKPKAINKPKPVIKDDSPALFTLDSERQCKICDAVKSLDDYYTTNEKTGNKQLHCKACEIAKKKAQRDARNLKK